MLARGATTNLKKNSEYGKVYWYSKRILVINIIVKRKLRELKECRKEEIRESHFKKLGNIYIDCIYCILHFSPVKCSP